MNDFYELIDKKLELVDDLIKYYENQKEEIDSFIKKLSSEYVEIDSIKLKLQELDIDDDNFKQMINIINDLNLNLNDPATTGVYDKLIKYTINLLKEEKEMILISYNHFKQLHKEISLYKNINITNYKKYLDNITLDRIFDDEEKTVLMDCLIKSKYSIEEERKNDTFKSEDLKQLISNAKHILNKKEENNFDLCYLIITDSNSFDTGFKEITEKLYDIYNKLESIIQDEKSISYENLSSILKKYDMVYEEYKKYYFENSELLEEKIKEIEGDSLEINNSDSEIIRTAKEIVLNYEDLPENEKQGMIKGYTLAIKQLLTEKGNETYIKQNIDHLRSIEDNKEIVDKLFLKRGDEEHTSEYYRYEDILEEIEIILRKTSQLGTNVFNNKIKDQIKSFVEYKNKGNREDITLDECISAENLIDEFKKNIELSNLNEALFPENYSDNLNVGSKSIVVFMTDKNGNYPIYDKLNSIDQGNRSKVASQLLRAISSNITQRSWITDISRMGSQYIDVIKGHSGKKYYVREKDDAKNFKYGNGRLSIYPLAFSEENKNKLAIEYGVPNLENVLLIGSFTINHNIDELGKDIAKCNDEIIKIEDLFSNPSTPLEKLKEVINSSSMICNKINEENEILKTRKGA